MQNVCPLKPNFVHGSQHIVGTGFRSDENTRQAALPKQLHLFITRPQQKICCGLNAPFEFQSRLDESSRDLDAACAVDQKVVVDDVDEIEPKSTDQFQDF